MVIPLYLNLWIFTDLGLNRQRKFRERKEGHVKELEERINSAAVANKALKVQNQRLEDQIRQWQSEGDKMKLVPCLQPPSSLRSLLSTSTLKTPGYPNTPDSQTDQVDSVSAYENLTEVTPIHTAMQHMNTTDTTKSSLYESVGESRWTPGRHAASLGIVRENGNEGLNFHGKSRCAT
jgi:hypothetical protein